MSDDTFSKMALTAQVVSAYVGNNATTQAGLIELIPLVHATICGRANPATPETVPEPAVPVRKSVYPDYIVCLEDGKKLKMLKRHLMASFGMTPEVYRERWGLPPSYPMTAPNYTLHRSALAKRSGLGRKAVEEEVVETAPRARREKAATA